MGVRSKRKARPLVVTVFGTRPQFIKLAVLWRELESRFRSILIDSGQHYDWELAGAQRKDTGLRAPDFHLGVGSASTAAQIARVADALDARLVKSRPHAVLVIGDTSTTAGGAIAAAYRGIPLAHIEAGLRSFDRSAPEEKNRVIADHLSTWRFCPTQSAIHHLRTEGIKIGLHGVGDLMYQNWLERRRSLEPVTLPEGVRPGEYYLVTAHRAENVDASESLSRLVRILESLDKPVIYPVHPRTRRNMIKLGFWPRLRRRADVHLMAPIPYTESLSLVSRAAMVLTDSGGLQREAFWSRVPCLILRRVTEWPELLNCGAGVLVDLDQRRVQEALRRRWAFRALADSTFRRRNPASAIAERLSQDLRS